jgi:hypothetical protein
MTRTTAILLAVLSALAVGPGCSRPGANEAEQKELAQLRADVSALQKELEAIKQGAASADRVSRAFDDLQSQINGLRGGHVPPLGGSADAGDHRVELFVRHDGQPALAMRYAGPSLKAALEQGRNVAGTSAALSKAVQVDASNPRLGAIVFAEEYRITPSSRVGGSAGGLAGLRLTVTRPAADSDAWELTSESRDQLKREYGLR